MKNKHEGHPCIIRPASKLTPHKYEVYCTRCCKHVQWAKRDLYEAYQALLAQK